MKKNLSCLILALLASCARFSTTQTDVSINPDGTKREITTKAKATTIWASKSALANWKASQTDKTQGATVGALNQESNNVTNVIEVLKAIGSILGNMR